VANRLIMRAALDDLKRFLEHATREEVT